MPIHNNDEERDLRHIAIGRNNWQLLGSKKGGEVACRPYSLVLSCKQAGVDPQAYIEDVLGRLATTKASDHCDPDALGLGRRAQVDREGYVNLARASTTWGGRTCTQKSVVRHATLCMTLITWTEVWAHRVHPRSWGQPFTPKLASLRAETVTETIFASGPRDKGSRRNARDIGTLFTSAASAA